MTMKLIPCATEVLEALKNRAMFLLVLVFVGGKARAYSCGIINQKAGGYDERSWDTSDSEAIRDY